MEMRAAAGLQVRTFDLDGAQDALPLNLFAHTLFRQIFSCSVAHSYRTVFLDNQVCGVLRALENFVGRLGPAQVDGANFQAEMKGDGGPPKAFLKHGGKQVLAGVLLHVVETASPIDAAVNRAGLKLAVDYMDDFVLFVANVEHVGVAEFAEVMGLAAGSRIEPGGVEHDGPRGRAVVTFRLAGEYARVEFAEKGIVVVEPASGHCSSVL